MRHHREGEVTNTSLICSVCSGSAKFIHGDLAREPKKTTERIIEETLGAWGRLNLLVNSASQLHSSKVKNVPEEEWHENINSNLSAPFFLSQVSCSCFHSRWDKQMTNTRTHASLLSIECSSCKLKCFTSFCLAYVFRLFYHYCYFLNYFILCCHSS